MATKKTTKVAKANPAAKKTTAKAKAKPKSAQPKARTATLNLPAAPQRPTTRRPPNNPAMPDEIIALLTANLNDTKIRYRRIRRVDAVESIHSELARFFKRMGTRTGEQPTKKKQLRDTKALIDGKKDENEDDFLKKKHDLLQNLDIHCSLLIPNSLIPNF